MRVEQSSGDGQSWSLVRPLTMGDREGGAIGQQLEVRRHARLLHFATTDDNYRAYGPPQTAVMQAYKPTASIRYCNNQR